MTHPHHAYSWRRRLSILLHRWHRRIGVLASLFVIWMVISGWLLNHTAALDLAQRMIHSPLLTQRYGLQADMPQQAFNAPPHWLVATQDALLLDAKKIDANLTQPSGLVFRNDLVFIADQTQLLLLNAAGETVDKLSGSLLPVVHIAKLGSGCNGAVITDGAKNFVTVDGVAWAECSGAVAWSVAAPLTDVQQKRIAPIVQPGISVERLLLDLHSGRFLGSWGPYFIDLVGLGLVALALSGLWIYTQHARRRRHLHH